MALPMDETSADIKIQSTFRGFSTRKCAPLKNLKIIHDVKAKAEDVRRHISDRQVVESIRQNEKERLKITEEIMSLILKLDAIQYPPVFSSDFARPPENPFFIMRRLRDRVQPKIFVVPVHDSPTNPKSAVPIPARFLNTESSTLSMAVPMDETSAAIKIQSAFRGFSTRKCAPLKNLKIIHDVKAKAEDVRRHIADRQVVESIRQNEKERLKITEEIMSLILKLDAIQSCLLC